jgi:cell division protein FtsW
VRTPTAYPLWEMRLLGILAAVLAVLGVALVYGASSLWAIREGQAGSVYAWRQFAGVLAGVVVLVVASRLDYHVWRRLAWPLLVATAAVLLVLVLPFSHGIAPVRNGARRWLEIGISVQPSEFAKFAVVAWTAALAAKKGDQIRHFKQGLLPFLVVLVPLAGLVVIEPDLSTGALLLIIAGTVLFVAGAKIGHFLALGLIAIPVLWQQIASVQYRLQRMVGFLGSGDDVAEASWQIKQSLTGIGAGRLVGVGFGEGMHKLGYLQYAYADFLFATIGEEWGFLGVLVTLALLGLFLLIGFRIARHAADPFGMYLATGLTVMIGLAVVLHVGVTLAVVPTTGISLPFLSYGRSALLVAFLSTGVLISVARHRHARGAGSR